MKVKKRDGSLEEMRYDKITRRISKKNIKENSKKSKHTNALVVDTSSSAPQKNINIRITISLIFLALIVPLFLGFISYSYKNNYEIFKINFYNNNKNPPTVRLGL